MSIPHLLRPCTPPPRRAFTPVAATVLAALGLAGCLEKSGDDHYYLGVSAPGTVLPVSESDSSATVSPSSLVADGVETAFITVQVRDTYGNPLAGQEVAVAATGLANSLTQPPALTNDSGFATARIVSTCAEWKQITVTVNPGPDEVVLVQVPTVEFLGDPSQLSAADSSVSAVPSTGLPAEGVTSSTITVVVRDVFGNPVAGQQVEIAATGSGNTITQPPAPTDGAGIAAGAIASTTPEVKTITATVNPGPQPVSLQQAPTVEFVPIPANTYYVRTSGFDPPDCSGGTSPATAWRTISKAAACVGAGDTVHVGGGTYVESVLLTTAGTGLFPIRFVADVTGAQTGDGGAVIVDAGLARAAFALDGADQVVLDGFTLTGSAGSTLPAGGASIVRSDDVIVRNCAIHGNALGIHLDDSDRGRIESNVIWSNFNTLGQGIRLVDADDVVIRNNLIYANLGAGILVSSGSTGLLIENNTLYRNGSIQIDVDALGNSVVVRDNVICDAAAGIVGADGSTVTSKYNDVVFHVWNWLVVTPGPGDQSNDPLFEDPDGADGILGGSGAADDRFQLNSAAPSPAIDRGEVVAASVALSDGSHLAQRPTGLDGVNDGTFPDGALVNLGYHYPSGVTGVPPPPALAIDDTRLVYATGTAAEARLRAFSQASATWSAATIAPPAESTIRWIENRISPTGSTAELFAVFADDGYRTELDLLRWSGSAWSVDWTTTAIRSAHADKRGFGVAYERISGDALVVYSDSSATPRYRTLAAGAWSAEQALPLNDGTGPNPDPNSGAVLWLELSARPGSDEIVLAYADENNDLVAIVWNGTQWLTASAALLENNLRVSALTATLSNRPFDVAFEALSGDVLVAWVRQAAVGFFWSQRTGGAWSAAAQVATAPNSLSNLVDLSAEAGSNRIAACVLDLGEGTEQLGLATWDGNAWFNAGTYDLQMHNTNDTAVADFKGGVGWVGVSGRAVCVYADDQTGTLDWASWTAAGGWVLQADVAVAGKGFTESVHLASLTASDRLVVTLLDSTADLYVLQYDGIAWTITNAGSPLELNVSSTVGAPFSAAIRAQ